MAATANFSLFLKPPHSRISFHSSKKAPRSKISFHSSKKSILLIDYRRRAILNSLYLSPIVGSRLSVFAGAANGSFKFRSGDDELPANLTREKQWNWSKSLLSFVSNNFLPLALVTGVTLGLINPTPGQLAHQYSLSKLSTFGIFIISGLTVKNADIGAAGEAWPTGLFGVLSILFFTPLFANLILRVQLVPREFVTGLAIFCCMPTTLSSGIALTHLAKGNSALALAMTLLSNFIGIFTMPLLLSNLIGQGAGVSIPAFPLLKSLLVTLLVPLVIGKIIRDSFSGIAEFVDQNRRLFSIASAVFLSLVPWIQISRSRSLLLNVQPVAFLLAICMGMLLHFLLLAFNTFALKGGSAISGQKGTFLKKENSRAVILVASQKTLPVMVAVVEQLHGALGESGLLVLPCVAAHINQIIIDSFLVNRWLRQDQLAATPKEE